MSAAAAARTDAAGQEGGQNVSVSVRIRPPHHNKEAASATVFRPLDETADAHTHLLYEDGAKTQTYAYDHVFDSRTSTIDIFSRVAAHIVRGVVSGYNGTVFAYGQTAAGKTHTMLGNKEQPGILPLAVNEIMACITASAHRAFLIRVSYIEIYNEVVTDLLSTDGKATLPIREHPQRGFFVEATEEVISTADDVMACLARGEKHRHVGMTDMNKRSSRSHTIFRIVVESRPLDTDDADASRRSSDSSPCGIMMGTLNLVDLAGSESVRTTNAVGERQREAGNINKSLLVLSRVIKELAKASTSAKDAGPSHTSFRDSKLTRVLQPSLAGNTRLAVICCISPAKEFVDETRSTLLFASSAKDIKLECKVNEVMDDTTKLRRLEKELQETRKQLALLKGNSTSESGRFEGSASGIAVMQEGASTMEIVAATAAPALVPSAVQTTLMQQYERTIAQLRAQIFVGGAQPTSSVVTASAYDTVAEAKGKSVKESVRLAAKGRAKRHRETWCPSGAEGGASVDFLAMLRSKGGADAPTESTSAAAVNPAETAPSVPSDSGDTAAAAAAEIPLSSKRSLSPMPEEAGDDEVVSFRPRHKEASRKAPRMHNSNSPQEVLQQGVAADMNQATTPIQDNSPAPHVSPRDHELIRLQSALATVQTDRVELDGVILSLRAQLETAIQAAERSEDALLEVQQKLRDCTVQLASDRARTEQLQLQLQGAEGACAERDAQLARMHAQLQEVSRRETVLRSQLELVTSEADTQARARDSAQLALAGAIEAQQEAAGKISELQQHIVKMQLALASQQAAASQAAAEWSSERSAFQEREEQAATDLSRMTARHDDAQRRADEGATKASSLQLALDAALNREASLQRSLQAANEQIAAMQAASDVNAVTFDDATSKLTAQLSDARSRLDAKESAFTALQEELAAERDHLHRVTAAREQAQNDAASRAEMLLQLHAQLESMEARCCRAEHDAAQLQRERDDVQVANAALKDQFSKYREEAASRHSDMEAQAADTAQQLQNVMSLVQDKLHDMQATFTVDVEIPSADRVDLAARFETIRTAVREKMQQLQQAQQEQADLARAAQQLVTSVQHTVHSVEYHLSASVVCASEAVDTLGGNVPELDTSVDVAAKAERVHLLVRALSDTAFNERLRLLNELEAAQLRGQALQEVVERFVALMQGVVEVDVADTDSVTTVIVDAETLAADVPAEVQQIFSSISTWLREVHENRLELANDAAQRDAAAQQRIEDLESKLTDEIAALSDLKQAYVQLSSEVGSLQASLQLVTAERDGLKQAADASGSDAATRFEQILALQSSVSDLTRLQTAASTEMQHLRVANTTIQSQLDEKAAQLEQARIELTQRATELTALTAELAGANARVAQYIEVESQLADYQRALQSAETAQKAAEAARQFMAEQVVQKELELTLLQSELETAQDGAAAADQRANALRAELASVQATAASDTATWCAKLQEQEARAEASIATLTADIQSGSAHLQRAREQITDLTGRLDLLMIEHQECAAIKERFEIENSSLERRLKAAEERAARAIEAHAVLVADLQTMREAASTSAAEVRQQHQTQLQELRQRLKQSEAQAHDMADALLDMKASLGLRTTSLENATAELAECRDELAAMRTRCSQLEGVVEHDLSAKRSLDAVIAARVAELQQLEARTTTLRSQLELAQAENSRLATRVEKLEKTKLTDAQVKKMMQVKDENLQLKAQVPKLKTYIAQLEAQLKGVTAAGATESEALARLRAAYDELQQQASQQVAGAAATQAKLEALVDELRAALDDANTGATQLQGELDSVRSERTSLQRMVDTLQANSARLAGECAAMASDLQAVSAAHAVGPSATPADIVCAARQAVHAFASRIAAVEAASAAVAGQQAATISSLNARCRELESASAGAASDTASRVATIAKLQKALDAAQDDCASLTQRVGELEQLLTTAEERAIHEEQEAATAKQRLLAATREAQHTAEDHQRAISFLEKENTSLMVELRSLRAGGASAAGARPSVGGAALSRPTISASSRPSGRPSVARTNLTALVAPRASIAPSSLSQSQLGASGTRREPLGALPVASGNIAPPQAGPAIKMAGQDSQSTGSAEDATPVVVAPPSTETPGECVQQ